MSSEYFQKRIRNTNNKPHNPKGKYVLYWMQAYRRMHYNHSLDFAVRLAKENNSKLIIYEGLRKDYPWSSPRLHKFILEGMCDNYEDSKKQGFTYWSYVEEDSNPARGLLKLLSKDAVAVVTDDFPSFIIPEQTDALSKKIDCTLYSIDGNSIIPIGMYGTFASAARILRPRVHLLFSGGYQNKSKSAYKLKDIESLQFEGKPPFEPFSCNAKDIDSKLKNITFRHPEVKPFLKNRGGRKEALKNLKEFLSKKLSRYHEDRNQPGDPYKTCVSLMSPYLHFGHISQEEIVREVLDDGGEEWKVQNMNMKMKGKRDDIYSKRPEVNSYLDELITWRDIGYHLFWQERSFKKDLNNLPGWAKENMKKHAKDKRKILYSKEQLDQSLTHDVVWNAAQKELKLTGRMHNYLRMLWGKKIIEWTPNYQTAFEIMEDFNNLYAYDGRNPNSYTGILWCFGLFDRPWFPERDVFGVFRYMSSDSTVKKLKMAPYYKYLEDVGGNGENLFIQ